MPVNRLQKQVVGCSGGGWNSRQAGRVVLAGDRETNPARRGIH
jgi:hypothetical protein